MSTNSVEAEPPGDEADTERLHLEDCCPVERERSLVKDAGVQMAKIYLKTPLHAQ